METDLEQHASSACDGITIKQEPVEPEPEMSPPQEIEFVSVKEETTCLQEWEQPEDHDSEHDPLSFNTEESSPPDNFIGPSTSNINKMENEEDEEKVAMTEDDRQELKQEVESTSTGSEPESAMPFGLKDDSGTNVCGTNDAGDLVTEQDESCGSKGGFKLYRCEVCKKTFTKYEDLKKHIEVESPQCQHSCSLCQKIFIRSGGLKRHLTIHTGEPLFSCTICNKTFLQSGHLMKHMTSHTDERPYICVICHKSYKTKSSMNDHCNIHAKESPITCNVCHKSFRTKKHLKLHSIVHNDLRPYCCEICKKSYKYSSSLKFHSQHKVCQRFQEKQQRERAVTAARRAKSKKLGVQSRGRGK